MYSGNVLKSYQVHIGIPYQIKQKQEIMPAVEEKKADNAVNENKAAENIIENARREAEKIINAAKMQADSILGSASETVARKAQEAEQRAMEEGYKRGEALAKQHYQNLIDEAEDFKQKAKELYDSTVSGLEGEIVETIIQIARKVIGTELTQNRDVIVGLVRTALSAASPTDSVSVSVSGEDYEHVSENKERILEGFKGIRDLDVVKDNTLKKGECIVDTGFGIIDSSIETQFQAVEETLRELAGEDRKTE